MPQTLNSKIQIIKYEITGHHAPHARSRSCPKVVDHEAIAAEDVPRAAGDGSACVQPVGFG